MVALLVYSRSPLSNYIFDEQEALLANPFVAGDIGWFEVFKRDFWGLPPQRTIGSYRPLPNLVWRALTWQPLRPVTPWILHLANIVGHAAVAAALASLSWSVTRRALWGWAVGITFLSCALLTEAVSGVVGLADVLGGLGVVLALLALRLPLGAMPVAVFAAMCLGFGGKESVVATVPLIGLSAFLLAPSLHPERPLCFARGALAFLAAALALVAYVEFRKLSFPAPLAPALSQAPPTSGATRWVHEFMVWFRQPKLPQDPMNNPLLEATTFERVGGALEVYGAGLVQLVFPWSLSADYSFPQEPIRARPLNWKSILGAVAFLGPVVAFGRMLLAARSSPYLLPTGAKSLVALGLIWLPLAYFPHSNLLVLLPTVRAERFWYLPAFGTSFVLGALVVWCVERRRAWSWGLVIAYVGFQMLQARAHALHYSDDLVFWRATKASSPRSAKAHLNYSIMVGARGDWAGRLESSSRALQLAPDWAMARIYQGDILCRLGRLEEAWLEYERGFLLDRGAQGQIALGLQCLWDRGALEPRRARLLTWSEEHRGTWLGYLAGDIVHNGELHGGVDPKYRPRGYNQPARRTQKPEQRRSL